MTSRSAARPIKMQRSPVGSERIEVPSTRWSMAGAGGAACRCNIVRLGRSHCLETRDVPHLNTCHDVPSRSPTGTNALRSANAQQRQRLAGAQ